MGKKRIVVFTGAGISAESGLKTFRDSDGLWENYRIEEVATPQAWSKDPALVNEFYNLRRKQVLEAKPNQAHLALVKLEKKYDVHIITQNIDDLHERAGSKKVLHLHGEIRKVRSTVKSSLVYDLAGWELKMGDRCELGSQLRPHIVWFGEAVPMMDNAMSLVAVADVLIVIGTSLNVYPAAGLLAYAERQIPKYLVDPNPQNVGRIENLTILQEKAGEGVPTLVQQLLDKA
ncbi:MAG: NAD-dependent deacylase [Bacteroidia bacterium]|nr:NAD-dependent deacylase [Bacteroidia bacterium]